MLAEVLGGAVAVYDPAGRAARRASAADGRLAVSGRARPSPPAASVETGGACTSPRRSPAPSTSRTLVLHGLDAAAGAGRAAHAGARRDGHRAGAAVRPLGRRGRGARPRGAARRPARRRDPADPGLRERARRQHVDLDRPLVVAVVVVDGLERHARGPGRRPAGGEPSAAWPASTPAGRSCSRPATTRWPSGAACRRAAGRPAATPRSASAGRRAATWRAAYPEARRCLDTLLTLGRSGEVSDPAGLGLARLLLGENGPEQLDDFVEPRSARCWPTTRRAAPSLVATLEAWYATGGRPADTAERAARAPQHRRPAARPGRRAARRRLARAGPRARPAARPAGAPPPRVRLGASTTCLGRICGSRHMGRRADRRPSVLGMPTLSRDSTAPCRASPAAPAASARAVAARLADAGAHVLGARPRRRGGAKGRRRDSAASTSWSTSPTATPSTPWTARRRHPRQQRRHAARRAGRGLRPRALRVDPPADARGAVPARPRAAPGHVRRAAGAGSCTSRACTATARRRTSPPTSAPSTASRDCPR